MFWLFSQRCQIGFRVYHRKLLKSHDFLGDNRPQMRSGNPDSASPWNSMTFKVQIRRIPWPSWWTWWWKAITKLISSILAGFWNTLCRFMSLFWRTIFPLEKDVLTARRLNYNYKWWNKQQQQQQQFKFLEACAEDYVKN